MRGSRMKFAVGIAAGFVAGIAFVVACGKSAHVRHDAGMEVGVVHDAASDRGFVDVLRDVFGVDAQDAHAQDAPCMEWQVAYAYATNLPAAPGVFPPGDARDVPAGWEPFGYAGASGGYMAFRRCVR